MKNEFLIGSGTSSRRAKKSARSNETPAPPPVDTRFLVTLIGVAALFVGLGFLRVHSVFSMRDDEMETRRLQELAQQQRDRYHSLTSRLAQLQRTEVLRTTAEGSLGMAMPEPQAMETLMISNEINERWLAAAGVAKVVPVAKEVN